MSLCAIAVADAFAYGMICHCSRCRAATGAASKPILGIERSQLTFESGEDDLMVVGDETGHDVRCAGCGFLFSVVFDGAYVHVAMGSLIDTSTRRPDRHIFVDSKAAWESITDYLPQYEGYGP